MYGGVEKAGIRIWQGKANRLSCYIIVSTVTVQSRRVTERNRVVSSVPIDIYAATKRNWTGDTYVTRRSVVRPCVTDDAERIVLQIPSPSGHVIPETVVIEPCLHIELLARQPKVLHNHAEASARCTERFVVRAPHD